MTTALRANQAKNLLVCVDIFVAKSSIGHGIVVGYEEIFGHIAQKVSLCAAWLSADLRAL